MKTFSYSKYLSKWSLVVSLILATGASGQEEAAGYMFEGLNISAQSGRAFFPVLTVDKRKIHVDAGDRTKKVSLDTFCLARPKMRLTDKYLEVLDQDIVTSSTTAIYLEGEAIAEMHRAQGQAETHAAIISSRAGGGSVSGDARGQIEAIKSANEDLTTDLQDGLDDKRFEGIGRADVIFLEMELLPSADIKGAYCVFGLNYLAVNADTGKPSGRRHVARVKPLGDLKKDKLFKLKKRFAMNEFSLEDSEYTLHIFTGEGEEVAMSSSQKLKGLSESDYQALRDAIAEAQAKRSGKASG